MERQVIVINCVVQGLHVFILSVGSGLELDSVQNSASSTSEVVKK